MKKTYATFIMVLISLLSYGQNVGDIIITEVMQNPSGADGDKEWFEIYNTTSSAINLKDGKIKYGSATTNNHKISLDLIVPANGYAVLGKSDIVGSNGGLTIDYKYVSSISLGNSGYTLGIVHSDGSTIIDEITWDNGVTFPDPSGKSMSLKMASMNSTDNDDGSNWEEATVAYGDGDLGTPGAANGAPLSVEVNNVSEYSIFPNPVVNSSFEITTIGRGDKEVSIYDVLGNLVLSHLFEGNKSIISTSSLDSGLYILRITEGDKISTTRLVIK